MVCSLSCGGTLAILSSHTGIVKIRFWALKRTSLEKNLHLRKLSFLLEVESEIQPICCVPLADFSFFSHTCKTFECDKKYDGFFLSCSSEHVANDSWISFSHFQCVSKRMYGVVCLSFSFSSFECVMPPFPILPRAFLCAPCCLHWLPLLCQLKVVLTRKLIWLVTSCI